MENFHLLGFPALGHDKDVQESYALYLPWTIFLQFVAFLHDKDGQVLWQVHS